ncbi:MAG: lipoprotein-releasing system ATP-binding protein LolD [Candidatus Altiarchaeales archaeon]|nr:MAG: lipoprotein-releasing system ATP-binding protein LolD [Candidatus Altiarchaeales archaeon]
MEKIETEPIIELRDVWKIYKMGNVEVPALRGLTMKVYPHEFVAIMGPSGSGKSTAMNMIGCLDVPTKGEIYLDGEDVSRLSESDLAQIRGRKIGFIFQTFNLMPRLTALENVMLPMTFQDIPRYERERRAKKLLEDVGLGKRIYHKPSELSGGERQRVAIARSLANNPRVILADEPTGNLDSKMGREIMEMLLELHNSNGKTIVMVTHDESLSRYADKIIHLRDGRITEVEQ